MKSQIIKNLELNGFPKKSVSLPLEKMYEVADSKGENLNAILDELTEQGIGHVKTSNKIIFSEKTPESFNPADFNMGGDMMKKVQEMMSSMKPEDLQKIKDQVSNMSEEEKANLMQKAKTTGLP
ncbi:MAG: hypothetical protein HN576_05785 [Bacteriovoracaceae bacterium]|nr:hypothetical protein [Bacteriovoracaceae bacterium]